MTPRGTSNCPCSKLTAFLPSYLISKRFPACAGDSQLPPYRMQGLRRRISRFGQGRTKFRPRMHGHSRKCRSPVLLTDLKCAVPYSMSISSLIKTCGRRSPSFPTPLDNLLAIVSVAHSGHVWVPFTLAKSDRYASIFITRFLIVAVFVGSVRPDKGRLPQEPRSLLEYLVDPNTVLVCGDVRTCGWWAMLPFSKKN